MSPEAEFIPIVRPLLGQAEADAARRAILSGWVAQGPEVAAFEAEFAAYTEAPYACAVSNGTAALDLALGAVGVGPGAEVITVSHSFIATANSVRHCGALPVFVDIEPGTYNMDPGRLEPALTSRTRALLCVHQLGMPCDLAAVVAFARRHSLPVVEDAACAIGSEIRWQDAWARIGKPHGDVACFSFHPRKVITTGDGGMLTTADAGLDRLFRQLRNQGLFVAPEASPAAGVAVPDYSVVGINARLTDIQAAVGREQLKRLPWIVQRRRALAAGYTRELAAIQGLRTPAEPEWARSNWQSYCVGLPPHCAPERVAKLLLERGIATRPGVMCAHLETAYRPAAADSAPAAPYRIAAGDPDGLPESERAQATSLMLPLYPQMTDEHQQRVIRALMQACAP